MSLILAVLVPGALVIGVVATWAVGRGERWRWGWVVERIAELGDGPYRQASVALAQPRRMPLACGAAAVTSVTWGVLTLAVFAPAGLIACIGWMSLGTLDSEPALGMALFGLAVLNGFALGWRLARLVVPLAVRTAESSERVRRAAIASLVHHAFVLIAFTLVCVTGPGPDLQVIGLVSIPCAIGAAQALLLLGAHATLARLDRDDAERAAQADAEPFPVI